ncbi:MAG TPA: CBS domain-containing protein, partial [Polyangiaceae bacterium]|nr:CBS domain-containing protein [Polyangiaceae bacterium]
FETTRQPIGLLPLLGGCTAAFLVSCLMMRNSIMTEKIVRRGVRVLSEYSADFLEQIHVRDCAAHPVVTLKADELLTIARVWLSSGSPGASHQAFPIVDSDGRLIGVLTRSEILGGDATTLCVRDLLRRPPIVIHDDCSVRDAADLMAKYAIGRLPVVERSAPQMLVGIVTRSDLVHAHQRRLAEQQLRRSGSPA